MYSTVRTVVVLFIIFSGPGHTRRRLPRWRADECFPVGLSIEHILCTSIVEPRVSVVFRGNHSVITLERSVRESGHTGCYEGLAQQYLITYVKQRR